MGEGTQYKFIAGPCAIEDCQQWAEFALELEQVFAEFPQFTLIYKGSFDKANRTLAGSPRGVGLVAAEHAWSLVREYAPYMLLTTDIHETWQAPTVANWVDVIQIPAFLGRQTDLIAAAGKTGRIVNLKKPQWEALGAYQREAAALKAVGAEDVWQTHRGTFYGPGRLIVTVDDLAEMASLDQKRWFLDLTHTNGGDIWRSVMYAQAAAAVGVENYFAEVHPNRSEAICDAEHQLSVRALRETLYAIAEQLP